MRNEKFVELRNKCKFSQVCLAEKMYVPIKTIRNWEYGRSAPSINDMKKMAEIFEVEESIIVDIFGPQKTKVAEENEKRFELYRMLLELFWGGDEIESFIKFAYIFSWGQTSGVICCCDYVFPFTRVVTDQDYSAVVFADSSENYVVLTNTNIIEVRPISADYNVYTFDVVIDCPIFPTDIKYSPDLFKQKIRLSFFNR